MPTHNTSNGCSVTCCCCCCCFYNLERSAWKRTRSRWLACFKLLAAFEISAHFGQPCKALITVANMPFHLPCWQFCLQMNENQNLICHGPSLSSHQGVSKPPHSPHAPHMGSNMHVATKCPVHSPLHNTIVICPTSTCSLPSVAYV